MELEHMHQLLDSRSEKAWSDALFSVAGSLGFDAVLYVALPSKDASFATSFLRTNCLAWRKPYEARQVRHLAPTSRRFTSSVLPLVWGPETFAQGEPATMYEAASYCGSRSGITFPLNGCTGEAGLISFATEMLPGQQCNDVLMHSMANLSLVRDYAFESSLKFIHTRGSAESVPRLTSRELQVLKWVMVGKSSWEIARIITRTEATINFHVLNVCRKLGVKTRQQALIKAIAIGVIAPEDWHR